MHYTRACAAIDVKPQACQHVNNPKQKSSFSNEAFDLPRATIAPTAVNNVTKSAEEVRVHARGTSASSWTSSMQLQVKDSHGMTVYMPSSLAASHADHIWQQLEGPGRVSYRGRGELTVWK